MKPLPDIQVFQARQVRQVCGSTAIDKSALNTLSAPSEIKINKKLTPVNASQHHVYMK